MLQISTAGTRKATHWPKVSILWSEFVEKIKTPVRGTETLEEYLAMPKARQDELKDVGGYVGGTFKGDRRKAALVEGRDLLTLDMDNICLLYTSRYIQVAGRPAGCGTFGMLGWPGSAWMEGSGGPRRPGVD